MQGPAESVRALLSELRAVCEPPGWCWVPGTSTRASRDGNPGPSLAPRTLCKF